LSEIKFEPIGFVRNDLSDVEIKNINRGDIEAEIELFERYASGLEGIDGVSHLIVIFYLHKVSKEQKKILRAKPRKLSRYGLNLKELPLVGVFCLDSPHRPNPIGLTIVRLLNRNGRILRVKGLDAFDGTPILDIKPYTPNRFIKDFTLPKWYEKILKILKDKGTQLKDF
jgi:tRNA-Thr(GGU) m(6)t(6)A37 methyltransferase TsaA